MLYLQHDRSRQEIRDKDGKPLKGGSDVVVRCDLRRALYYSPDSVSYSAVLYPPPRITEAEARRLRLRTTPNYRTVEPTLRIEITYKDTGERKEAFGLIARHIIITDRQIPMEGQKSLPRTEIRDGWYINLQRRTSCEQQYAVETKDDPVIYPNETIENVQTVKIGDVPDPTESWIPVEETHFARQTVLRSDGSTTEVISPGSEQHITKIEEIPMDPALFGPPAFYATVPLAGQR
jgi:hypothetical protein